MDENQINENDVNIDDIEVEVIDDTPEEDRGREPVSVEDPPEDEVKNYSENVQTRIRELTHARHDERRAKETALREREEAIRLAQQVFEQNKLLKSHLQNGEQAFMENAKKRVQYEYEIAKKKLLEAKSIGDIEAEINAQEEFNQAQLNKVQIESYKQNALQDVNNDVNIPNVTEQVTQRPQTVDQKALAWKERNPWFWVDRAMTGAALGTHEELVESGYDPQSDEYYRELDSRLRDMFPKKFSEIDRQRQGRQNDFQQEIDRTEKRPSTVVAPATRSSRTKKISLSKSEVSIARRLNLTPEMYAKYKAALEN